MTREDYNLIALAPGGFVDGHGTEAFNVDGLGLDNQIVQEDIGIVDLFQGNDDHGRYVAAKIQDSMELHGSLSFPEFIRPLLS